MSKAKKQVTKDVKPAAPVLEVWKATKASLQEKAAELTEAVSEIAARVQAVKAQMLIPFLCELWQAERLGKIEDTKTFLLDSGFPTKDDAPDGHPLTMESAYTYFGKVKIFMNKGYTRADIGVVSLPNLVAGAAYAGENLTQAGKPAKTFVNALQTEKGQVFRKNVSDGKFGETKRPGGNGKPKKSDDKTGGKNNTPDKLPTNTAVLAWADAQMNLEVVIAARDHFSARIKNIRDAQKRNQA